VDKDKVNNVIEALAASLEAQSHLPALRTRLEEEFADHPYQLMAVYQRNRHATQKCEKWPDRPTFALAMSRYPNILAELDASGCWLDRVARYARVSMEIMATVMEDNGELSWQELEGLKRCFDCKLDYLISPVLSMVDPSTNKGRVRLWHLRKLVRQTEGMDRYFYDKDSKSVLPALESGKPVTYAAYRWACNHLQDVLDGREREEARQQRTRTVELTQVQAQKDAGADLRTRLWQARERVRVRAMEARLDMMTKYAENCESSHITAQNLYDLIEFSKRDQAGALILAARYGYAAGYRTALSCAAGGEAI